MPVPLGVEVRGTPGGWSAAGYAFGFVAREGCCRPSFAFFGELFSPGGKVGAFWTRFGDTFLALRRLFVTGVEHLIPFFSSLTL